MKGPIIGKVLMLNLLILTSMSKIFRLHKIAFTVEISLAKARKEDSKIRIRNKEELLHAWYNFSFLIIFEFIPRYFIVQYLSSSLTFTIKGCIIKSINMPN